MSDGVRTYFLVVCEEEYIQVPDLSGKVGLDIDGPKNKREHVSPIGYK